MSTSHIVSKKNAKSSLGHKAYRILVVMISALALSQTPFYSGTSQIWV